MQSKWFAVVLAGIFVQDAGAAMPVAQQNAIVQKYCAVCHNDAHLNGGLSLQHFDAAHADPGVAATILSKLTSLSLETVKAAQTDPAAAVLMDNNIKRGAMGVAGVPVPDRATEDALVSALSKESAGAKDWVVNHPANPGNATASILCEIPTPTDKASADMYRLILACNRDTHEGEMRVTWAPGGPRKDFVIWTAADNGPQLTYNDDDSEKMFRGATGKSGFGVVLLARSGSARDDLPLPEKSLTISNVSPDGAGRLPIR